MINRYLLAIFVIKIKVRKCLIFFEPNFIDLLEMFIFFSISADIDYGQTSIVMLPEEDLVFSEIEHRNASDLVILTDINAIDL